MRASSDLAVDAEAFGFVDDEVEGSLFDAGDRERGVAVGFEVAFAVGGVDGGGADAAESAFRDAEAGRCQSWRFS